MERGGVRSLLTPPHDSGKCEDVCKNEERRCDLGHHHGQNEWSSGTCLLHGHN